MGRVSIVMGSASDKDVATEVVKTLMALNIGNDSHVVSAHRDPKGLERLVRESSEGDNPTDVYIGIAGIAAALPGAIAALRRTTPVIGVPVKGDDVSIPVNSMVHMPPGVPVAVVGGPGAGQNAAILAVQILGLKYPIVTFELRSAQERAQDGLAKKNAEVEKELNVLGNPPEEIG